MEEKDVSNEVLQYIFGFLTDPDFLINCTRVSKKWQENASVDTLWKPFLASEYHDKLLTSAKVTFFTCPEKHHFTYLQEKKIKQHLQTLPLTPAQLNNLNFPNIWCLLTKGLLTVNEVINLSSKELNNLNHIQLYPLIEKKIITVQAVKKLSHKQRHTLSDLRIQLYLTAEKIDEILTMSDDNLTIFMQNLKEVKLKLIS
jgi:hypothetical protein